jgi:hypothetical protein
VTGSRSTKTGLGGHPLGTPNKGLSPNTGPLATAAWLVARDLVTSESRWHVQVTIGTADPVDDEDKATLLRIELFNDEWGYWFRHAGRVSWIRVTDLPFVHGRDEHGLLAQTPSLKKIGDLLRALERRFDIELQPRCALLRTNLSGAEPTIRDWLATL